jgi:hypothetical protein
MSDIAYKVLTPDRMSFTKTKGRIEYYIARWVYPRVPHSKLFVFDSIENARRAAIPSRHRIYKCEVKNPQGIKYIAPFYNYNHVKLFWKLKHSKKKFSHLQCTSNGVPQGTLICDAVKLIERMI